MLQNLLIKLNSGNRDNLASRGNRNVVQSKLRTKTMLNKGVRTSYLSYGDEGSQVSVNRSPSPWELENTESSRISENRGMKSTGRMW